MNVTPTCLPCVLLVEPQRFSDARGFFMETWNREKYEGAGMPAMSAQDNLSWSRQHVLRGLHFQFPYPQAKLVYALEGAIFDVAVDLRQGSAHFGEWVGTELSHANGLQLYIPEGFAHGFCAVSETALVAYKCSNSYRPDYETGVIWNDPTLAIRWPTWSPILSMRDAAFCTLEELPRDSLPRMCRHAEPLDEQRLAIEDSAKAPLKPGMAY